MVSQGWPHKKGIERARAGGEAEAAGCAPLVEKGRMVGCYSTRFVAREVGPVGIKNTFDTSQREISKSKPG